LSDKKITQANSGYAESVEIFCTETKWFSKIFAIAIILAAVYYQVPWDSGRLLFRWK
jgi:hypothetical protein